MIQNNNLSPLAFYESTDLQNANRGYVGGNMLPLYMPVNNILPFQLIVSGHIVGIQSVSIYSVEDSVIGTNIKSELENTGLTYTYHATQDKTVIKYKATGQALTDYSLGLYYLVFNIQVGPAHYKYLVSEHFSFVDDVSKYIKLEYSSDSNIESKKIVVDFADAFKFVVYLRSELNRPEYEFEETVVKRDGYQFVEKQVSEKIYKFSTILPEYLCDALRIVRMCDNINVTSLGIEYDVDTFLMTPKWSNDGAVADVEFEFQCDTVLKRSADAFIDFNLVNQLPQDSKMYVGKVINQNPSEIEIRALTELAAVKQTTQYTHYIELGKRNCFAYPASFGDLVSIYYFESFDLLSVYTKSQMTFMFGSESVLMNIYVYNYPVTFAPETQFTITFKFD